MTRDTVPKKKQTGERYTRAEKETIRRLVTEAVEREGLSIPQACAKLGVVHSTYQRWFHRRKPLRPMGYGRVRREPPPPPSTAEQVALVRSLTADDTRQAVWSKLGEGLADDVEPEVIDALVHSPCLEARFWLGTHSHGASASAVAELATDASVEVRRAVAERQDLPLEVIEALLRAPDFKIATTLVKQQEDFDWQELSPAAIVTLLAGLGEHRLVKRNRDAVCCCQYSYVGWPINGRLQERFERHRKNHVLFSTVSLLGSCEDLAEETQLVIATQCDSTTRMALAMQPYVTASAMALLQDVSDESAHVVKFAPSTVGRSNPVSGYKFNCSCGGFDDGVTLVEVETKYDNHLARVSRHRGLLREQANVPDVEQDKPLPVITQRYLVDNAASWGNSVIAWNLAGEDALKLLAGHSDLAPSMAAKLAKVAPPSVREVLAGRPDLSLRVLKELARDRKESVRVAVARQPGLAREVIEVLAERPTLAVGQALITQPAIDDDLLIAVLEMLKMHSTEIERLVIFDTWSCDCADPEKGNGMGGRDKLEAAALAHFNRLVLRDATHLLEGKKLTQAVQRRIRAMKCPPISEALAARSK